MFRIAFTAAVALLLAACTPRACDDTDHRIARDVATLLGDSELAADAAQERLVARGRPAIALLETGLYDADPVGRRRIVKTLVALGNPEAIPILDHLARHDPDEGVREAASAGAARLR